MCTHLTKKTFFDGKGFYRFFCMLYDNGSEERRLGMLYGMNSMFSIYSSLYRNSYCSSLLARESYGTIVSFVDC